MNTLLKWMEWEVASGSFELSTDVLELMVSMKKRKLKIFLKTLDLIEAKKY